MRDEHIQYLRAIVEERVGVEDWPDWWQQHRDEVRQALPVGWYFRLQGRGARAAGEVLEKLGVPFEVPEQPMPPIPNVGEGCCPLCEGEITEQERYGHFSIKRECGGGGGFWYRGRCEGCDIDFHLTVRQGTPEVWHPLAPEPAWLIEQLGPDELEVLNNHPPTEYPGNETWETFVRRAGPEDEFWTFSTAPEVTGIARLRRGVPIAQFYRPSPDFLESWNRAESEYRESMAPAKIRKPKRLRTLPAEC